MLKKQEIILRYYREGESMRKISRALGIHRRTVKKYLEEYEAQRNKEPPVEGAAASVEKSINEPPKYNSKTRKRRKLSEQIARQIDAYLTKNEEKRKSGKRKQQLKKVDIWELLKEQGYEIGYTTVCNYIRSQQSIPESYIRPWLIYKNI